MGLLSGFNMPIDPAQRRVERRHGLQKLAVAAPLLSVVVMRCGGVALRRAAGRRHACDWTLHEELLVTLMRTLLLCGDIGVW